MDWQEKGKDELLQQRRSMMQIIMRPPKESGIVQN
jgi:hypothetical protein